MLGEQDAVGGQREVLDPLDAREFAHEVGKPGAQERLSAGEADLAHAFGRERARQPLDLVEGQSLCGGQEAIALAEGLARHAIRAAEVAAVHDRDAQVQQRPSAQVDGRARRFEGHEVVWDSFGHGLPAIERHGETRGMSRRPGRQLDEPVGAGEGDEVA